MNPSSEASRHAGRLYIVSAPSGAGKTTLIQRLVGMHPDGFAVSVSHTTRPPRPGEEDGVAYHFVSDAEFLRLRDAGAFIEHAQVFGCHYGTLRRQLEDLLDRGKDVILEIDWQGARQIRRLFVGVTSVFILPPSLEILEERLKRRDPDSETLARRREDADDAIFHYREYDCIIVNDDLEGAVRQLDAIYVAGSLRRAAAEGQFDGLVAQMCQASGR